MQVITEYSDEQLPLVLEATEKLNAHLTAAVVSNDPLFTQQARCSFVWSHERFTMMHSSCHPKQQHSKTAPGGICLL